MKKSIGILAALALGVLSWDQVAHAQTTSNYIFRFNTGISSVFLSDMTFPNQQQINLGSCTATEKINGPLVCAVNCSNQSVCLLDLSGPSGASVNDVLEKVSETPSSSTSASPTPTDSGIPAGLGEIRRGNRLSSLKQRVEAYNSAGQ